MPHPTVLCLAWAAVAPALVGDEFPSAGPAPVVRVTVEAGELEQLRKDDRKYVRASVTVGEQTWREVGLHVKGSAGSRRDWDDKPALTLNADKFRVAQSIFGLGKFHLNNAVQDGSYLNEIICYDICREAGLPSPRAAHTLVELNGRKVGLYVLKEGYDAAFLKRYFANAKGNLYDGGFLQDIDGGLRLDRGSGNDGVDLKSLAEAARIEDHAERLNRLSALLDVDKFVTLWAIESLCGDWDGYARNRNNYRIYHDPKADKFVMIPHGKDQLFQHPHDGLVHGWGGLLARRLYQTDVGTAKYRAALRELTERFFTEEQLLARADALGPRVRDALNQYRDGAGDEYFRGEFAQFRKRLRERARFLAAEVAKPQ